MFAPSYLIKLRPMDRPGQLAGRVGGRSVGLEHGFTVSWSLRGLCRERRGVCVGSQRPLGASAELDKNCTVCSGGYYIQLVLLNICTCCRQAVFKCLIDPDHPSSTATTRPLAPALVQS